MPAFLRKDPNSIPKIRSHCIPRLGRPEQISMTAPRCTILTYEAGLEIRIPILLGAKYGPPAIGGIHDANQLFVHRPFSSVRGRIDTISSRNSAAISLRSPARIFGRENEHFERISRLEKRFRR